MILYHGSPKLFDRFDNAFIGNGTGLKYGYGHYLSESVATAVHYSEPRPAKGDVNPTPLNEKHYLYTVEIPDLVDGDHIVSAPPVPEAFASRIEAALGKTAPEKVKTAGKEFRKWVGCELTGIKMSKYTPNKFEVEKAASGFLRGIGVRYTVWPTSQSKPDGLKNVAVFQDDDIKILKVEEIEIEDNKGKWVLVSRKEA